jgi:hypothetical protein
MMEACTFTCRVDFAVHDTIFTESFDGKDRELGTIKLRYKKKAVKEEICSEDERILGKLKRVVGVESREEVEEAAEEPAVETSPQPLENPPPPQERWTKFAWQSHYEVDVTHFKNPDSFLVIPNIAERLKTKQILQAIEDCPRVPLEAFEIGATCGVDGDKVRRGKIMTINGDDVSLLLVDAGEVFKCKKSDLLQLPLDLITKVPFQAIHCRMLGVKPKYNMSVWPPLQCQVVRELITSCQLKVFVVRASEEVNEFSGFGLSCYDVFLVDRESGDYLDETAVRMKIVDRDGSVEKPTEEDLEEMTETEDEKLLLQLLLKHLKDQEKEKLEEELEEGFFDESSQESSEELPTASRLQTSALDPPQVHLNAPPPTTKSLDFIYKHPTIEWRQNQLLVKLSIAATDCQDYALVISNSSLEVTIKFQDRIEKAVINFYSPIEAKLCSHELRGLSIVVRLPKKFPDEWKQLADTRENIKFLKFVDEEDEVLVEEGGYSGMPGGMELEDSDGEEFSDDGEKWMEFGEGENESL